MSTPSPTAGSQRSSHHRSSDRKTPSSRAGSLHTPAVESAVTRLLVAIKQLLEALTLWSTLKMSELEVSDVYVRLGNDFNAAVAAFGAYNIDMSELLSVPDDLRNVLEQCLGEEATPANLDQYLPTVRQIITSLLQGLRNKQSIYRKTVADKEPGGSDRQSTRSSRVTDLSDRDSIASRSGRGSSGRRAQASSSHSQTGSDVERFVGGFAPVPEEAERPASAVPRSRSSANASHSRSSPLSANADPDDLRSPRSTHSSLRSPPPDTQEAAPPPQPPPLPQQQIPPEVKRYSLVDTPMPTSPSTSNVEVVVEAASPRTPGPNGRAPSRTGTPPPTTPPVESGSAMQNSLAAQSSLAALKRSEALERRASKRFSTYTFSKMTGMGKDKGAAGRLAAGNLTLSPGDLEVLAEGDEDAETPSKLSRVADVTEGSTRRNNSLRRGRSTAVTPEPAPVPPVPPVPTPSEEKSAPFTLTEIAQPAQPSTPSSPSGPMQVFLQVGRQVKKVSIDPGLSFASLRMLFMDRFSYNPGQDNFPEIYIRDPASGVQYELEDISEVKGKCLLSLNIEPLDQIKQHIDAQIATLSQDLKDLKSSLGTARRMSMPPAPSVAPTPAIPHGTGASSSRPSDEQLQRFARRVSRMQPLDGSTAAQPLVAQVTGGTLSEEQSSRIVTDLRTHFDEVGNLRRDLGVLRQLYTDFMSSTKESLGTLRSQATTVKQLADSKVGGARAYIDSGKTKLDSRSQTVLTRVEELQDTIEALKDDVLKRHVTPKTTVMKKLRTDIEESAAELESLKEVIKTVKPMWKKTWEEELQNIVEEQQFLSHQEEFLNDLIEDHKAVSEVYGHVEKVISLRGSQSGRMRSAFRPPPLENGTATMSSVMLEIRGAQVDPEKRLKAIEASQKSRQKELATRSDEFQDELHTFVQDRKLKMTGGAEEAERVRQKRNDATLRAMFNGSGGPTSPSAGASSP